MPPLKDLTGKSFGQLFVIERASNSNDGHARWRCKCSCGKEKIVLGKHLISGAIDNCGCLKGIRTAKANTTHGLTNTRIYNIWIGIKIRCSNKKRQNAKDYINRGITICNEWKNSFQNFYNWSMNNGYADNLTIDRIDNNGNYEPSNCRWATYKIQNKNRRSTRNITYNNETHCVLEWSEILGIKYPTLIRKLNNGITIEDMINGASGK